ENISEEESRLVERSKERESLVRDLKIPSDVSATGVQSEIEAERQRVLEAETHISVLDTLGLNAVLTNALAERKRLEEEVTAAEQRLAKARITQSRAKALFDAARRAAGETLDRRLERIGPLLGELYRRLKPHPFW